MDTQQHLFLTLQGIPRTQPLEAGEVVYFRDHQGAWPPPGSDLLYEIEAECVRIHDGLEGSAGPFGRPTRPELENRPREAHR